MQPKRVQQRGAARARAAQRSEVPWALAMVTVAGVMVFGVTLAQGQAPVPGPVPEVVKPRTDAPTLPPSGSDRTLTTPIPDTGVIAPPSTGGTTPVLRPPTSSPMPVIPPPGSAGGDRTVVPK